MSHFAAWFSPAILHAFGWALVHFLWEGLALAALFAGLSAFCRTASARYLLGVATLAIMVAAPAITFTRLMPKASTASSSAAADSGTSAAMQQRLMAANSSANGAPMSPAPIQQSGALLWFVEAWFAGVVFLSLRAAGGFLAIERMRRKESKPVSAVLLEKCLALQRRLRLDRFIRYCECRRLDAPAVIGWFRPVILLPLTALTGLSDEQLEAVIAHELAHIRRFDSFVNLFQVAAETLLFYHPAVWWVSKRIRDERENCCDDVAITVCGDAVNYARALTLMEEWRSAPALAMAANRSPLAARVARLLGMGKLPGGVRSAGFAASTFCLAGALLAGNAFVGVAQNFFGWDGVPQSAQLSGTPESAARAVTHPAPPVPVTSRVGSATPNATSHLDASPAPRIEPQPQSTSSPSPAQSSSGSYIEDMKAAGFDNLTVEQLIALKTQGVTPDYVKAIHDLGLKPSVEELIGMKVQGITPEYIRDMRAAGVDVKMDHLIGMKVQGITPDYVKHVHDLGLQPSTDELVSMKVQGISPEYIQDMRASGVDAKIDQLIGMKVQGITPDYVKHIHDLGLKPGIDELVGMKVQGITPEYIRDMRAAGVDAKTDRLIGMKVQGITPEYVKQMHDLGIQPSADELVSMKVQGISPEYIRDMRATGFNPSIDQLVGMKVQGVTPEYVQALKKTGMADFKDDPDNYIAAKVNGITPEFIQTVQSHGFKDLDLDKLIALKRAGIF
ncbi:MAG TPA: M56 family metallopeptidase [Candidatus Acidoferrales bacterium]|nr:M56 family metallopeptidase [Candidatus Acidoferrales bacterium]